MMLSEAGFVSAEGDLLLWPSLLKSSLWSQNLFGHITSLKPLGVESSLYLEGGTLLFILTLVFSPAPVESHPSKIKSPLQGWNGMQPLSCLPGTLAVALFYFQFSYLLRWLSADTIVLSEAATWCRLGLVLWNLDFILSCFGQGTSVTPYHSV